MQNTVTQMRNDTIAMPMLMPSETGWCEKYRIANANVCRNEILNVILPSWRTSRQRNEISQSERDVIDTRKSCNFHYRLAHATHSWRAGDQYLVAYIRTLAFHWGRFIDGTLLLSRLSIQSDKFFFFARAHIFASKSNKYYSRKLITLMREKQYGKLYR